MKKILGISLVALFAATPMMAGAGTLPEVGIVQAEGNEIGDANKMATVSYVKGAYGTIRTAVNSKAEQSDLTAAQNAINTLNGDAQTTGSVDKKIADAITSSLTAESTNDKAASAKATYDAIQAAIDSATYDDSQVQQDIADLKSAGYITKDVDNLTNYTTTTGMNTAIGSAIDSALEDYTTTTGMNTAIGSAIDSALEDYTTTTGMNTAIGSAIDSALEDYTTTTGLQNTYATKGGVTATISSSTIAASVPALASWNDSTVTSVAVNASITGAGYRAE